MSSTENSQSFSPANPTQINWWESEWYKEWVKLAKRDYHGRKCGRWHCYVDKNGELQYIYTQNDEGQ